MPQKRRSAWGATQKQAEEFSRERVLKARVKELEAEVANSRAERQLLADALTRANATVQDFRRGADAPPPDPHTVTFVTTAPVYSALVKLASSGLWGPFVNETAEEIVRIYIREGLASGKVPSW